MHNIFKMIGNPAIADDVKKAKELLNGTLGGIIGFFV